jgi:curli biogenesis system outer membrane secretion channel CsgG
MNWTCFQTNEDANMNCKIANRRIAINVFGESNKGVSRRSIELCFGLCVAISAAAMLGACANTPTYEVPRVDALTSTQALKKLPRKQGERVAVSIFEFRSTVNEIAVRGATDIFKTALVQSGQFRVVERSRLNEGVIREKQLNSSGLTSGNGATEVLTAAKYIFEGAITEGTSGETQRSGAVRVAGAELGASTNKDVIGIDVRVVDVGSSEVVDVVTVRKTIASDSMNVSGIGNLIGSLLARKGKNSVFVPDIQLQQQRKESMDVALRAAIDESVLELSRRFAP